MLRRVFVPSGAVVVGGVGVGVDSGSGSVVVVVVQWRKVLPCNLLHLPKVSKIARR